MIENEKQYKDLIKAKDHLALCVVGILNKDLPEEYSFLPKYLLKIIADINLSIAEYKMKMDERGE